MNKFIIIAAVMLLFTANGCKVRTVSQGKPPRDGVVTKEVNDAKYGKIKEELFYREGRLEYVQGTFDNGKRAYEKYLVPHDGIVDSTVWFYPSGALNFTIVSADERILRFKELYENGAVRMISDTSESNEFYIGGQKNCRILYENSSVISIERWFENGKRMEYSEWQHELRHGKHQEWDSTGRSVINDKYQRGTLLR
jgi:antitoxin component YwqK of YwqJK toxin-antitoxin module